MKNLFEFIAPSAPLNVSASSPSFSTISLTWNVPLLPNGIIRDYQITYFPSANSSDVTTVNTGSSSLEYNITGLIAFTNYSIAVSAITVELGEMSITITLRTNESGKFTG